MSSSSNSGIQRILYTIAKSNQSVTTLQTINDNIAPNFPPASLASNPDMAASIGALGDTMNELAQSSIGPAQVMLVLEFLDKSEENMTE